MAAIDFPSNPTAYPVESPWTDPLGNRWYYTASKLQWALLGVTNIIDNTVIDGSTNPVSGNAVFDAIAASKVTTGTGVAAALALPVGTTGAVQLNGDPLTPTSIVLPDMTGIIAPTGRIGFKNGYLATSDGVTPGGKVVAQRRYTGIAIARGMQFMPNSAAFTRLVGIPFSAAEFVQGREFNLTGHLLLKSSAGFTNITNLVFGTAFDAGSLVAFNQSSGYSDTSWMAWNYTGLTSLSPTQPIKFDLLSSANAGFGGGGAGKITMFERGFNYLRSPTGVLPSFYDAQNDNTGPYSTATEGVANNLWFMLQVNSSTPGGHSGHIEAHYDLTLEFTN